MKLPFCNTWVNSKMGNPPSVKNKLVRNALFRKEKIKKLKEKKDRKKKRQAEGKVRSM